MTTLLVLIYIAFISLGLPDAVLGSAWPSMFTGFGVPVSSAGIISMIVSGGTIVSSLNSARLIRRFGTGLVTLVSVGLTAFALLGMSFAGSFSVMCLLAVPLGLGAGSVDSALNSFVALHYKAAHMSWLHSFWGVGASLGPVIMSWALLRRGALLGGWQGGYRAIGLLQTLLVAALVFSLPLWKAANGRQGEDREKQAKPLSLAQVLRLPKAIYALAAFFFYCSLESTVGLWSASYLVFYRGIAEDTAAGWVALYFAGITIGRMLGGFLSLKVPQRKMIYLGLCVISLGILSLLLPYGGTALAGLFLIGFGCAPIFPGMLHETPRTFGEENSQSLIGVQMAGAYLGTTMIPPAFGLIGAALGYGLMPFAAAVFFGAMAYMISRLYAKKARQSGA